MPPIASAGLVARVGSCSDHYLDDFVRDLSDVSFSDELQENTLQRRLADLFANLGRRPVGNDLAFSEDDQVRADFFYDFKDMGAIKDSLTSCAQRLNQIPNNEGGSYIEAGQ